MKDNENIINRQRANIAVLSLENANLKICVEDLKAEIENKNVEIDILIRKKEALRDEISALSAEVEELQTKNKKYKAILEAINDEINPLPFETDFDKAINKAKSEAIREFAEKIKQEINFPLAVWRVFDNLVKEMTEQ